MISPRSNLHPGSQSALHRLLTALLLATTLLTSAFAPPAFAAGLADIPLVSIDGGRLDPSLLAGKVVLVVNVASFCGYTPQYSELQALYDRYDERGLVVLGVPSNQFGDQEPGSNTEIRNFCSTRYGVTFPLLQKQDVNGATRSPLYQYLVDHAPKPGKDIGWNFEKFLVGRDGRVLARFTSQTPPLDPTVLTAIEIALK